MSVLTGRGANCHGPAITQVWLAGQHGLGRKRFLALETLFLPFHSDSLTLSCGVTSRFERWGDIEVTAQHHELLRTPSWGNITQTPGQSPASKRWCEKRRSRTGAMGHPEKEDKASDKNPNDALRKERRQSCSIPTPAGSRGCERHSQQLQGAGGIAGLSQAASPRGLCRFGCLNHVARPCVEKPLYLQ